MGAPMPYVPQIDDMMVAPPYQLGAASLPGESYELRMNIFYLKADHATLVGLVDEQLNNPFPATAPKYSVPIGTQVFVAFYSYGRAESQTQPHRGWLAYNECMIGFAVLHNPWSLNRELHLYLGVVYIDGSKTGCQVVDPYTIPICIGREGYGLPKNPGQIACDPNDLLVSAQADIWDLDPTTLRRVLRPAIRIHPFGTLATAFAWSACSRRLWSWFRPPAQPKPPERFGLLRRALGIRHGGFTVRASQLASHDPHAIDVLLADGRFAIARGDLHLSALLVGHKQFPDPRALGTLNGPGGACYRALVESPIEEVQMTTSFPPRDHIVEFPMLNRPDLDLLTRFGILGANSAREVVVYDDDIAYEEGVVSFANPNRVNVW